MTTAIHAPSFGQVKPKRKGLAALLTHHTFRRLTQLGVFLFIAAIAIRHMVVGENGATITACASWSQSPMQPSSNAPEDCPCPE